jgi:hypothetical protein
MAQRGDPLELRPCHVRAVSTSRSGTDGTAMTALLFRRPVLQKFACSTSHLLVGHKSVDPARNLLGG